MADFKQVCKDLELEFINRWKFSRFFFAKGIRTNLTLNTLDMPFYLQYIPKYSKYNIRQHNIINKKAPIYIVKSFIKGRVSNIAFFY